MSTPANRVQIVFINRHRLATTVDNNNIRSAGRLFHGPFRTPRARVLSETTMISYVSISADTVDSYLAAKIREIVFSKYLRPSAAEKFAIYVRK